MNNDLIFGNVYKEILDYQKLNNIKEKCMSNCIVFKDLIERYTSYKIRLEVGILNIIDFENFVINNIAHVWCVYNDEVIELSYEYTITPHKIYTPYKIWIKNQYERLMGFCPSKHTIISNSNDMTIMSNKFDHKGNNFLSENCKQFIEDINEYQYKYDFRPIYAQNLKKVIKNNFQSS